MPRHPEARLSTALAVGLMLFCSLPAAADNDAFEKWHKSVKLPVVRVRTVADAPKVDGRIDDVYKKHASPLKFSYLDGFGGRIDEPTVAYIVTDGKKLYFAVHCKTENPDRLVCQTTERDKGVWKDEAVEIFLDPRNVRKLKNYYHIMVNPAGVTQDAKKQKDNSWNPDLDVKCTKDKSSWTMELAIPFTELGIEPGRMNKVWALNLTRSARDPDDPWMAEETGWSPTKSRTSHMPSMFGYMWLDAGHRANE
jgi:hypothetical protein